MRQRAQLGASTVPQPLAPNAPPLGWCLVHEAWAMLMSGFVHSYWPNQACDRL